MSIEIRTPNFVPEFVFIFLNNFFGTRKFFKKSGVEFVWDYKNFDRRKFENFVQKSTSEKSKASKNRRWHLEIGVRKP